MGEVYRLNSPTMGIHSNDGQHKPVMLPAHSLITVIGSLDGNRFVDCVCDDAKVMMFAVDIHERGILVK